MTPDARLFLAVVLLLGFVGAMAWAWYAAEQAERRDGVGW